MAQKKISLEELPKIKTPKDCKDPKNCTSQGNVISGSGNNVGENKESSKEEIAAQNKKANEFLKSNDEFFSKNANAKLKEASKATVQILPKCAIGIKDDGYSIVGGRPLYCAGHPLSKSGMPTMPKEKSSLANPNGEKLDGCGPHPCSGALVGDQETITTAGHCLNGMSPKDFCKDYVFVFNRTDGKTEFSKNDVAECDVGEVTHTSLGIKNFNMNADYGSKDHAVFKLKKPVEESVAKSLKMRTTELNSQEELFAMGHPKGSSRMVSTLKSPRKVDPSGKEYNYAHMEGYVYEGNSGGPLLDKNGEVVGILSAVDDKRYGDKNAREPMVIDSESKQRCRTQVAPGAITVEAVTYGNEIKNLMKNLDHEVSSDTSAPAPSTVGK